MEAIILPCYHPKHAWYSKGGISPLSGKRELTFDHNRADPDTFMLLPCGKCQGCRTSKANEWALRCFHESKLHSENSFITLTYNDSHPHSTGSLRHDDITTFLKALRHHLHPRRIRYFHCGEYGGKKNRPHHHMLIFGYIPPDIYPWMDRGDYILYRSPILEKLWPHGFSTVGVLTQKTCFYVTKYQTKVLTILPENERFDLRSDYISMSRYPGLGIDYFRRYYDEILNAQGCHIGNGVFLPIPRYYLRILEKEHPLDYYAYQRIKPVDADTTRLVRDDPVGTEKRLTAINSVKKRLEQRKPRPLEYY